jgi:hypothetical protein
MAIASDEAKHTSEEYVDRLHSTGILRDHHLHSYLIIKRRIVWLIGRWVNEDCYPPTDPRIWQILLHLLTVKGTGTEVVRLTASTALQQCVDVSLRTDNTSQTSPVIFL